MDRRTIERFWAKVEVNDETGCWEWAAGKFKTGYGSFQVGGKNVYAHRFAWEAFRGPIPDGLQIDHLCRVRHCVNPDHLEPVDQRTNILRGVSAGAVNATKTECANGHPFDEANTYRHPRGMRVCRTCHRLQERERYSAKVARA